ncbi:hypothetical protein FEP07_04066 [Burkholderia multivorans]|nr:hypothetical protein [Burkholderia multivorans]MDR9269772.1 hypothetical protein [Burkholderia multivorans]MDR9286419.1 hypothetical protein [Burkholderia multivorans]MDR9292558.1 hypothetical protein [Burkholderia multivorans]MDR9315571.1 hypothetical protein [Burkholderia multivorans]
MVRNLMSRGKRGYVHPHDSMSAMDDMQRWVEADFLLSFAPPPGCSTAVGSSVGFAMRRSNTSYVHVAACVGSLTIAIWI